MATDPDAPPGVRSGYRWTAGVDWITYIARHRKAYATLAAVAEEIEAEHIDPASKRRPFKLGGYEGWQIGALRLGRRSHCAMIQVSGSVCASSVTKLAQCGGHPTRLDVQTTLQLSSMQPRFGRRFLRPVHKRGHLPPSQLPRSGLSQATTGLFLGTVGDRTSGRYLRVYDKGIESDTAPRGKLWRAEYEAKQRHAPALWAALLQAPDTSQFCWDAVADAWKASGYSWPLKGPSRSWQGVTLDPKPPNDTQRLARWMRRSVAPAVERLLRSYSPAEVRQLLQLHTQDEFNAAFENDVG